MDAMPQAFQQRKAFNSCESDSGIYDKLEYQVLHTKAIDMHSPNYYYYVGKLYATQVTC